MKSVLAVTGIVIAAAFFFSKPVWGACACTQGLSARGSVHAEFSVPPPDDPRGPSTGVAGQRLTYTTTGTDPLGVHEFQYDWGDGSNLSWKDNKTQSHTYQAAGTFDIKVREKCPLEFFQTGWSGTTRVTITGTSTTTTYLLTVNSSPVTGFAITGTSPGTSSYTALLPQDTQVTLTAPASATVRSTAYTFQNWVLNDVAQDAAVATLTLQMTANMTAQAAYAVVNRNLSVQSAPVTGIAITGSSTGPTNYAAVIPDNTQVTLTAPPTFSDEGVSYGFTGWSGLASMKESSMTQRFRIKADSTLTAAYGPIQMSVVYPNDSGIIAERGKKISVAWDALNLPKGFKVKVELVNSDSEIWTLTQGASKSPWKWTVGAPTVETPIYTDGDGYRIRVSALDGAVSAESENPFTVATVQSLTISGPTSVQGGTGSPTQYTCTAHYNFGGDTDSSSLVKWKCLPTTYAKIGKTGLLTSKLVTSDEVCTLTATYGKSSAPVTDTLDVTVTP